jgi:hypothetical protein
MGFIIFLLLVVGFFLLIRAGKKKAKSPSVSTAKTASAVRPIPPPPPPPPPLPSTIQPKTPDEDREPFSFEKAGLLPERISPSDYAEGQDSDAWESLYGFAPERRLEIELEIDYKDRNGQETTRRIRLKRFACNDSLSDAALMAHCYLRGGFRSFRASRVQRCVDAETGEIIRNLPQYLLDAYASSPAGLLEAMWEKYGDELAALVYVGKLDGRLMKKEKEVIVSYMRNRIEDCNLGEADLLEELKAVDVLSKNQFARCLGRLSALNDLDRPAFIEAVEAILATKKAKSAAEKEVIPYIRKRLGLSR